MPPDAEIQPPRILYPDEPLFSPFFRQGNPEFYLHHIWLPLWEKLSEAEKEEYLCHWNAPEEWKRSLQEHDQTKDMTEEERLEWLNTH